MGEMAEILTILLKCPKMWGRTKTCRVSLRNDQNNQLAVVLAGVICQTYIAIKGVL